MSKQKKHHQLTIDPEYMQSMTGAIYGQSGLSYEAYLQTAKPVTIQDCLQHLDKILDRSNQHYQDQVNRINANGKPAPSNKGRIMAIRKEEYKYRQLIEHTMAALRSISGEQMSLFTTNPLSSK